MKSSSSSIAPVDVNSQEYLDALRHSCAHVMAQAVQELFPGTKITIGPAIENGLHRGAAAARRRARTRETASIPQLR